MAKVTRLRYDGVETYLDLQLDRDATTMQFSSALLHDGGQPVLDIANTSSEEYLALSILDGNYRLLEIVHVLEYTSGSLVAVVDRGMEGTTKTTHPSGAKVVHAPTVDDFLMVQDHDSSDTAHLDLITSVASGLVDAALEAHVNDPPQDPHPYYVLEDGAVFTGDVTFDNSTTVTVEGVMNIVEGAQLVIHGDLIIEGTGRIFINGHELIISKTEPSPMRPDIVWIQTFGV